MPPPLTEHEKALQDFQKCYTETIGHDILKEMKPSPPRFCQFKVQYNPHSPSAVAHEEELRSQAQKEHVAEVSARLFRSQSRIEAETKKSEGRRYSLPLSPKQKPR